MRANSGDAERGHMDRFRKCLHHCAKPAACLLVCVLLGIFYCLDSDDSNPVLPVLFAGSCALFGYFALVAASKCLDEFAERENDRQ